MGRSRPKSETTPEAERRWYPVPLPCDSYLSRLREAEEPARAHRQHRRHDEVDDEELALRHVVDGGRTHHAAHEGAHRGSREAAEAADHHHREGKHDHLDA